MENHEVPLRRQEDEKLPIQSDEESKSNYLQQTIDHKKNSPNPNNPIHSADNESDKGASENEESKNEHINKSISPSLVSGESEGSKTDSKNPLKTNTETEENEKSEKQAFLTPTQSTEVPKEKIVDSENKSAENLPVDVENAQQSTDSKETVPVTITAHHQNNGNATKNKKSTIKGTHRSKKRKRAAPPIPTSGVLQDTTSTSQPEKHSPQATDAEKTVESEAITSDCYIKTANNEINDDATETGNSANEYPKKDTGAPPRVPASSVLQDTTSTSQPDEYTPQQATDAEKTVAPEAITSDCDIKTTNNEINDDATETGNSANENPKKYIRAAPRVPISSVLQGTISASQPEEHTPQQATEAEKTVAITLDCDITATNEINDDATKTGNSANEYPKKDIGAAPRVPASRVLQGTTSVSQPDEYTPQQATDAEKTVASDCDIKTANNEINDDATETGNSANENPKQYIRAALRVPVSNTGGETGTLEKPLSNENQASHANSQNKINAREPNKQEGEDISKTFLNKFKKLFGRQSDRQCGNKGNEKNVNKIEDSSNGTKTNENNTKETLNESTDRDNTLRRRVKWKESLGNIFKPTTSNSKDSSTGKNENSQSTTNSTKKDDCKKKPMNILDLQSQLINIDEGVDKESIEFIELIKNEAKKFETKIQIYSGTNYSVEYFVINENLMRLLEELDKMKFQKNKELLDKKIDAINYINQLYEELDKHVNED